MPRYRLRYQSTNLEMPLGEFSIGRSSDCNLALSDPLVSRRHAVFRIDLDEVSVEDLGSRNGISVNGTKVESGPCVLQHMDRVYIGSQELVLIDAQKLREGTVETSGYVVCVGCGAINGAARRRCGECGKTLTSKTHKSIPVERPTLDPDSEPPGEEPTRTARALDVIGGIASKAIAMGRFEDAERMLSGHLEHLLERASEDRSPTTEEDEDSLESLSSLGTRYALQLGEGLQSVRWIDWVFAFHTATHKLMEAEVIETLHNVVRKTRYSTVTPLRDYLASLQRSDRDYSAGDRFLLRRLEGLEQVIASN